MRPASLAHVVAALRGVSLLAVVASLAGAQNLTWIEQFGTSSGDVIRAAAPDGLGGLYVTGDTTGSLGGPNAGTGGATYDAWLARYDGLGTRTWIRQLGTSSHDLALAAASDGAGGVYVSGRTQGSLGGPYAGGAYDAWLAHYDAAGNQSWVLQLGTSDSDEARAAASDGTGGVYVCGGTRGSLGGPHAGGLTDAWLARYDSLGNQTWIRQFGTASGETAYGAAPDGTGGVYVSGNAGGSLGGPSAGSQDAWIARYDGLGNQSWVRQLGTSANDGAADAAPDGAGGVFVCGFTFGSLGGPHAGGISDAWLAHYDGAGNQTWIRQIGTSDRDSAGGASPDGAGGVYVSGQTAGSLGGPNAGDRDAWLARYDGLGTQTWIRQLGTSGYDYAGEPAPDGAGGVFVSGSTTGSLGGPNAGQNDAWIAGYDGSGPNSYCNPAVPNSTGQHGRMSVTGSLVASDNDATLVGSQLPLNSVGYFITSRTQGFVAGAGGSQGNLCLSGEIGRFVRPDPILYSTAAGRFSLVVDLSAMPTPLFLVAVQPGDTWNFQAWYRDANPTITSNFTDAVSVTFQ